MGLHVKILGWFYIVFACLITVMVLLGHIAFLSSLSDTTGSVFASDVSYSQRYFAFFEDHGITPLSLLNTLWNIVSSFAFGYGILRYKEWARLLGLVIGVLGIFIAIGMILSYEINLTHILQLALSGYTLWVLVSKEVSAKCE